jgi:hypothetical protein
MESGGQVLLAENRHKLRAFVKKVMNPVTLIVEALLLLKTTVPYSWLVVQLLSWIVSYTQAHDISTRYLCNDTVSTYEPTGYVQRLECHRK